MGKKVVSSRDMDGYDFEISAEAEVSAFGHDGSFGFSLKPVSVIVKTDAGKYRFDLKKD